MLQDKTVGRTTRSPVQLYQSATPWANLFNAPSNPVTNNVVVTPSTVILDPFGTFAVSYAPTNSISYHGIAPYNINTTATYISGSRIQQTIYVKPITAGNTKHLMAIVEARPATGSRLYLRYRIQSNTGQVSLIFRDSGWTDNQATAYALSNGWWKLVVTATFTGVGYNIYSSWEILDGSNTSTAYAGDNTSGVYLYGPQAYYRSTPDETINDVWIDSGSNTTKIWNGYSFVVTSGSTTTYYLSSTTPVITKEAGSASDPGAYSSATVYGYKNIGSTITTYGFYTITANTAASESTTAIEFTSAGVTIQPTNTAGTSNYTIKLYDRANRTEAGAVLHNTLVIPVVFSGVNTTIYYLDSTSPVITKTSQSEAVAGTYSTTTVFGKAVSGNTVINPHGSYTITASNGTQPSTTTPFDVLGVVVPPAGAATTGISSYTVRLYSSTSAAAVSSATLQDTLIVPVVFSGTPGTGADGLSVILSNDSATVPTDTAGSAASGNYTTTGTTIFVYEGINTLTYDGVGTTPGKWKVTAVGSGISVGAITLSTPNAVVANAINMTADVATITYTITGQRTSGTAFTIVRVQTFSKTKTGATTSVYYLDATSSVFTKTSESAAVTGTYSTVTVFGKEAVAGTITNPYGHYTTSIDGAAESATAPFTAGGLVITPTGSVSQYTIRLYDVAAKTNLRDTLVIPTIFKGATGAGGADALTAVLTNDSATIPTDSAGANGVFTNSGTSIFVYEGNTALTYNPSTYDTGAVGTWKVSSAGSGIVANTAPTGSGTTSAVYGNHSSMTADVATVTYTINVRRANNTTVTLTKTQTFSKSKSGATPSNGLNASRSKTLFMYYWSTVLPTTGTGPGSTWNPPFTGPAYTSTYTWATDVHAYSSGGAWSTTPGTSAVAGAKLWTASISVVDTTGTQGATSVNWAQIAPTLSLAGNSGNDGTKSGIVYIYQWALNGTVAPANPTGGFTYTWATNQLSGGTLALGSWTTSPGTPTQGWTLWQGVYYLNGIPYGDTSTAVGTWDLLVKSPISFAGQQGTQGISSYVGYARINTTATPIPGTVAVQGFAYPDGAANWGPAFVQTWTLSDPSPTSGFSLYKIDGLFSPLDNATFWSAPYITSLKVGTLDAVSVNTGALTVTNNLTMATSGGSIRGGKTSFGDATNGFFLGYDAGAYKFSLGTPSATTGSKKGLTWDGSTLVTNALEIRDKDGNIVLSSGGPVTSGSIDGLKYTNAAGWYFGNASQGSGLGSSLGWTISNATVVNFPNYIRVTTTSPSTDPILSSPVLAIAGTDYRIVRAKIKRVAGTAWQGTCYYSTASHGVSENYTNTIAENTGVATVDGYKVYEWNMAALTAGGTDWTSNTITAIRLDLGSSVADVFDVSWIAISAPVVNQYLDWENPSTFIANGAISTAQIGKASIVGANIASATITDANIATATITSAKIASLSAGLISVGVNGGATTGSRIVIESNKILVYDGTVLRVKIGDLG